VTKIIIILIIYFLYTYFKHKMANGYSVVDNISRKSNITFYMMHFVLDLFIVINFTFQFINE